MRLDNNKGPCLPRQRKDGQDNPTAQLALVSVSSPPPHSLSIFDISSTSTVPVPPIRLHRASRLGSPTSLALIHRS
ncbi:hypothetical protein BHE90_013223 [Fusarium euwallaceae]|uniref:Uncharacterized protein n=5 Tax=Fusarium solani species complex TaxID=232080 RepID=A0A3M2S5D9_9HYPO|nr:hypothetical protein CDV36_007562 [Fusarium kuroshium]RSL80763.1 hypothetical protein CEP51_006328 [Fusarium floridanum]RSM04681.1 hypothetical protein CEP52_006657 [Fusarium oligoseptatum]RSM12675.1 hypothetical protein CDV31_006251 [Fusarium ambrosium]RTE72364.1 hypothetical protein BHE90_013223 [Fusarium euwallaceae]